MIHALKSAFGVALRRLFTWKTLSAFIIIYVGFLAALYTLVASREASVSQVILTLVLAIATAVLFLTLQSMTVRYTSAQEGGWRMIPHALRDSWRLAVMAIPAAALLWLFTVLLARAHWMFVAPVATPTEDSMGVYMRMRTPTIGEVSALTGLRFLLAGFVVPLFAIHLWIAAARDGIARAFRGMLALLIRACSPTSMLAYLLGAVVFGVVPFFLIFLKAPTPGGWMDVVMLGIIDAIAGFFVLVGWTLTVGALAELARVADERA